MKQLPHFSCRWRIGRLGLLIASLIILVLPFATVLRAEVSQEYFDQVKKAYGHARQSTANQSIPEKMRTSMWVAAARKKLRKLAAEQPGSLLALEAQAWASYKAGRDDAIPDFDAILQRQSGNPGALKGKAWYYYQKRKYRDALSAFDAFVRAAPLDPGAYAGRGLVYHYLGRDKEARVDYSRFLCITKEMQQLAGGPFAPDYRSMVRETFAGNSFEGILVPVPTKKRTPDYFLAEGVVATLGGFDSTFEEAYSAAVSAGLKDRVFPLAAGKYSEALAMDDKFAEALFMRAMDAAVHGPGYTANADSVRIDYDAAVKLRPDDPIFRAGWVHVAAIKARGAEQDARIAAQNLQNQQFRQDMRDIGQLIVNAASVMVAVSDTVVGPEYIANQGAPVIYHGPGQCKLCGGTGSALAHPMVEWPTTCYACDARDTRYCSVCRGSKVVMQIKRGDGPREPERCPDCLGTGKFNGSIASAIQADDGRAILRAVDRAAIDRGNQIISAATTPDTKPAPTITSPAPPTSNSVRPVEPQREADIVDRADVAPKVMRRIAPDYPEEFRRAGITGSVTVQFIVMTDGTVAEAVALKSTHQKFEAAAIKAVMQWRFTPGSKNGRRVNTRVSTVLVFELSDS